MKEYIDYFTSVPGLVSILLSMFIVWCLYKTFIDMRDLRRNTMMVLILICASTSQGQDFGDSADQWVYYDSQVSYQEYTNEMVYEPVHQVEFVNNVYISAYLDEPNRRLELYGDLYNIDTDMEVTYDLMDVDYEYYPDLDLDRGDYYLLKALYRIPDPNVDVFLAAYETETNSSMIELIYPSIKVQHVFQWQSNSLIMFEGRQNLTSLLRQ